MRFAKLTVWVFALHALGMVASATADEHEEPGLLARMWQVTPKADAGAAFNEGFKKHLVWRKENKDPWGWSVYYATSGDGVNSVFVRSGNHHWKDFDAYRDSEFSAKAQEHWNEHVDPHVAHYSSSVSKADKELQNWPDEDAEYRYFWVTTFYLKSGHAAQARSAVKAVFDELQAANYGSTHGWIWATTGDKLPALSLVSARENWAGLGLPDKGAFDVMVDRVGQEKATQMFADFFEHVKNQSSHIFAKDLELSYDAPQ